jgi:hypothetical protein
MSGFAGAAPNWKIGLRSSAGEDQENETRKFSDENAADQA